MYYLNYCAECSYLFKLLGSREFITVCCPPETVLKRSCSFSMGRMKQLNDAIGRIFVTQTRELQVASLTLWKQDRLLGALSRNDHACMSSVSFELVLKKI